MRFRSAWISASTRNVSGPSSTLQQLLDTIDKIKNATPKIHEVKPQERKRGNVSNPFGNSEYIKKIKPIARKLCYSYCKKINVEDTAIALHILNWLKTHPTYRKDGSLPQQRIRRFWETMYQEGTVKRQFRAERWKEIRKMLTFMGIIEWQDTRYWRDQAMKGELSNEMHSVMKKKKDKTYTLGQFTKIVIIPNPPMPINCWGIFIHQDINYGNQERARRRKLENEVLKMMRHAA